MSTFDQTLSDADLVAKSLVDPQNFRWVLEKYQTPLRNYIRRISGFSEAEIDEILQEVFLKAWQNLNGFDPSQKFSSWLYRIAHNQTISTYRRETHHKPQSLLWDEELQIPDTSNFLEEIDAKISAKNCQKVLQLMSLEGREVLILKFLENFSYEEISDILRKPENTVGVLIYRAKKEFKFLAQKHNFYFY